MKRIVFALLAVAMLVSVLASCSDEKNRTHTVGDLTFTVPERLRVTKMEGYELYLSTMEYALAVQELTDEILIDAGTSKDDTLEVIVDKYFEKNNIDKEQCELTYSESQNAYKFRYSVSLDGESYYFHYIIIMRNEEHIYFVDMFCDFENGGNFLSDFKEWGETFKIK